MDRPKTREGITRASATYALVLPRDVTSRTRTAMAELPSTLPPNDHLISLAVGYYTGPGSDGRDIKKLKCLVGLTEEKIVVADERDPRNGVELALGEWRYASAGNGGVSISRGDQTARLERLLPPSEAGRIQTRLGFPAPRECFEALGDGPRDPGHLPIGALGAVTLYPDRLIDARWRHLPISDGVKATVDATGNLAVTRGRNLAAKAWGTVFFGLPGMLLFGNAREYHTDARELYLLVDGPNWALTEPFDPNAGHELREFAQQINLAARGSADGPGMSLATALRELAALRDEGILSNQEFDQQKQRLLRDR